MTGNTELFDEARRLMEAGEIPDKVSNRLLWAAFSNIYCKVIRHDKDIAILKWAAGLIGTGIIGLAANAIFG